MKNYKPILFIILVLMLISGYIVIPFSNGNIWEKWGDIPMKWGSGTTTLTYVMWFFGIRFLLLLDGLLMIMLIYMKQTKLSVLLIVSFIIITRVVDIIQLFIDGDVGGSLPIEMTLNAIFLFFVLSAVNIIKIKGLNINVANVETSVITLNLPFSKYISNLFRPKQKLDSINLVEDLLEKDKKLKLVAEQKEKFESPLLVRITRLIKMFEKAETTQEREVLMHEIDVAIARYAKSNAEISEMLKDKKKANG